VWGWVPHAPGHEHDLTTKIFWGSVDFDYRKEYPPQLKVTRRRLDGDAPPLLVDKVTNALFVPHAAMLTGVWAQSRAEEFNDARVSYYWDGDKLTGKEWQKVLDIESIAWDVYLLYGPNSYRDGSTAKPAFWMHQLEGVTKAPCLNKAEFESKIKEMLATLK
jgi:hypothetical protein